MPRSLIAVLVLLTLGPLAAHAAPSSSPPSTLSTPSTPFPDVPADHWAAPAVQKMKDSGIMRGYPNGQFKGDKPITRFELAVALDRMVEFVEKSRALIGEQKESEALLPSPTVGRGVGGEGNRPPAPTWAKPSADALISGGFLPKDTSLLKEGSKSVSPELLAQSLASVVARLATLDADRSSGSP